MKRLHFSLSLSHFSKLAWRLAGGGGLAAALLLAAPAQAQSTFTPALLPTATPLAAATPLPTATPFAVAPITASMPAPPTAQSYVRCTQGVQTVDGVAMVPVTFLPDALGASTGQMPEGFWRITYFEHVIDFTPNQWDARCDGLPMALPAPARDINGLFYVPWAPLAQMLGVRWSIIPPEGAADAEAAVPPTPAAKAARKKPAPGTLFLLQYPAAYIEDVRHSVDQDKVRVVLYLSNATRVVAAQQGLDTVFHLAASRRPNVPTVLPINDYLVPRSVTRSGSWKADFAVRLNYAAPTSWFTLGNPPRLVMDFGRLFEDRAVDSLEGGLALTRIRKGTASGPVQMFVVRIDPSKGWRLRVAPAGYSVMKRDRPSQVAQRHRALVAVNGGFFAYDGAAVGALMINGEWMRLPWKGRTAVGFKSDGTARIDNLQTQAHADFSSGMRLPVRDLNGWPDLGTVSALTTRFGPGYRLRPNEIAVEVKNGVVVAKPGGGVAKIYTGRDSFTLVANGGAKAYLNVVQRGERATLNIQPIGWDGITSALGGGPRLLRDGAVEVTALRENFRSDVRVGRGPRTAMGIDRDGRYIIVVVDGRQPYYSVGLTLNELAYTMQQFGAVDALNLDGGGSTVIAVKNSVINRPSDGHERSVSNALLVMR